MKDYFLADDLSGALDAAAAFHHAGRRVRVVLSAHDWTAHDTDEVVGVTTETRNASPAEAAATVDRAIARGTAQGARLVYKKIDSTLRGPVAAEVATLARHLPAARILFSPANPSVGRTVRDGVLLVHGVPLSETEFAHDPVSPVRESNLRRLLGDTGGGRMIVADAATEGDLAAAVARMTGGGEWVAVGSGALARPVAALGRSETRPPAATATSLPPPGPVLLLGGSAHAGNRTAAARLTREHGVPVYALQAGDPGPAIAAAIASLRTGGAAGLLVEATRRDSALLLREFVLAAHAIITATGTARIFATGGETAFALCGTLGVSALEFHAELESGLSLSRGATPRGPLLLAIKPGGFGTPETWVRAWAGLKA